MIATLVLSAAGFVGITQWEAFRGVAYNDGVGTTTIGFGTTKGVKPGDKITVERALVVALEDANRHGEIVKRCVKVPLFQHEFDAYTSLAYNIGAGKSGVVDGFCWAKRGGPSMLVKKLNEGDYAGACAEISRWTKAGGKELRGLVKRRAAERAMCEGNGVEEEETVQVPEPVKVPEKVQEEHVGLWERLKKSVGLN